MAKKKQELTVEEKLAAALVRADEQPYGVPGNWVWTRLGSVITLNRGVTYKKNDVIKEKGFDKCLILRGGNIEEGSINFDNDNVYIGRELVKKEQMLRKDDIVIVSSTGSVKVIGRAGISDNNYSDVAFGAFLTLVRPVDGYNKRLIALYFQTDYYRNIIRTLASGVNINNIKNEYINNVCFPLPPLAEQQRIVDRIESLFDQLDQAKALIQEALDSFETRKAAILHQAFTGALTKKWREEHGVGLESWEEKPLSELCTNFQYGTSKKSLATGKVAVIRMGNLQQGEIVWDNLAYTNDAEDIEKYFLKKGDVLFNRTNSPELVGKTSVYRGELPAIYAGYLIRLNTNELLDSYYLNYLMNSQRAKIYCNAVKTDGVNQSNINAKKIAAFEIPVCSIPEQQEIVRILDDLFAKEQAAKDLCDLIDQIDTIKKTILGKAFRGELGTNVAGEESAVELLKFIL